MKLKKEFLLILIHFFLWFSVFFIIFFIVFNFSSIKNYFSKEDDFFLNDDNFYSAYEQKKINQEVEIILQKRQIEKLKQQIKTNQLIEDNTSSIRLNYVDFNDNDNQKIIWYKDFFELFLNYKVFSDKILDLNIDLYKSSWEVRWKLYWKKINLYEVFFRDQKEVFSVFIHEFAHFIDLYYFQRNIIHDLSDEFYKISWDNKGLLADQNITDFVTWYSMSNKYEDFAESFVFYVLYNNEFLQKTKISQKLKKKYDFFTNYVFTKWEFIDTSFSNNNNFSQYIRDSTKLNYNLENLLKYFKK